jgi:hypothetical protein
MVVKSGVVLIKRPVLDGIVAGKVSLAFRRWDRPRVVVGTRLRTAVGVLEVLDVRKVKLESVSDRAIKQAGFASREAFLKQQAIHPDRPLWKVKLRYAGDDPRAALRENAELSEAEVEAILGRLERMDKASSRGPWTATYLRLIASQPGVRAPDLAAGLGLETLPFKRDVRKLKELGLTESLPVGYRISPRGSAILTRL